MKNYYTVLGLAHNATVEQVRTRFRELARLQGYEPLSENPVFSFDFAAPVAKSIVSGSFAGRSAIGDTTLEVDPTGSSREATTTGSSGSSSRRSRSTTPR